MVFPSDQIRWNGATLLVYGHATSLCRKRDSQNNVSTFMSDFRYILTPATAASKPLDRLDRGPPRHGIAVYGAASLSLSPYFLRQRFLLCPLLLLLPLWSVLPSYCNS